MIGHTGESANPANIIRGKRDNSESDFPTVFIIRSFHTRTAAIDLQKLIFQKHINIYREYYFCREKRRKTAPSGVRITQHVHLHAAARGTVLIIKGVSVDP